MKVKRLLVVKGANLAEMTRLGLPIPQVIHDYNPCCCMDYLADATFFEEHLLTIRNLKVVKNLETGNSKIFYCG